MPASSSPSSPVPIATIDSPSAMITIRAKRSAKCPGETRKPLTPNTYGPAKSIASATNQSERLRGAVQEGGDDQQRGGGERGAGEPPDRLAASTSSFASAKMKMWSQRAAA